MNSTKSGGKRALVTGGAGFIGSHVADLFLAEGYAVEIIDDLSSGHRHNVPDGTTLHAISVTSPEAAEIIRSGHFDVIAPQSSTWPIVLGGG